MTEIDEKKQTPCSKKCHCDGGEGCCQQGAAKAVPADSTEPHLKKVVIDFLYLDLNVCQRCQGAEQNLDEAIAEVAAVLESAGYHVTVNKVKIASEELALKHKFLSSPTIRVNSQDIILAVTETACKDCGELCGDNVDCRSWEYEGVGYDEPPKAMIINAIMKAVYGDQTQQVNVNETYVLPENLKKFFAGQQAK